MTRHFSRRRSFLAPFAAALLVAALSSGPAGAQVTTGGVEVRGFLARTTTQVWAATHGGGLFRSADKGLNWTRIALPGNERYLSSIAGNSNAVVLVGGEEGLARTTDPDNAGAPAFTKILHEPVTALAVGPGTSNRVLAGVRGVGLVRSTDGGATFTVINNAVFDSLDVTAIAFDSVSESTAFVAMRPDGQGNKGGIWRSLDGGLTWASYMAAGINDKYISSLVVDGASMLYAGALRVCNHAGCDGAGPLYFRANGAGSWSSNADFFGVVSLHRDANSPNTIWVGTRGLGLRKGATASFSYEFADPSPNPNFFFTGINAAVTIPSDTAVVLKAIKGAGVWRSAAATNPRTWTRLAFRNSTDNTGADRVLSATGVAGQASTILAGLYAGGVWRSANSGSTWSPPVVTLAQADFAFAAAATAVNAFVSIWELSASVSNPNVIYAAAGSVGMFYSNDNPGLFRFNGTSWGGVGNNATAAAPWNGSVESGIALNIQQIYGVAVNRSNDQVAYASYLVPGGVFTRGGTNWTQVVPPGLTPQIRSVALATSNANKQLALPFDDKAALSTNGGASYTQVTVSQTGFERLRFFAAAESPANASIWIAGTNKGLFRSADGGVNWSRVAAGAVFQQLAVTAVGFKSGTAFAGDWGGNRYCSNDGGVTWKSAGAALRAGINAIKPVGSSLYYLTDGAGLQEVGTCPA